MPTPPPSPPRRWRSGKGVAEIVLARGLMSRAELDDVLRPEVLTQPRPLPVRNPAKAA